VKKSELTKQRILEAAETEFAAKGIYGARVDDIAERAKANKRMIYEYFGSKEQLYSEVLGVVYSRITEREKELLNDNTDCIQAIRNIIAMYFEFLNSDRNFVKLIMWENLNQARYIKANDVPITPFVPPAVFLKEGLNKAYSGRTRISKKSFCH
jgi:TetR/AcrR family transcriptional regulator